MSPHRSVQDEVSAHSISTSIFLVHPLCFTFFRKIIVLPCTPKSHLKNVLVFSCEKSYFHFSLLFLNYRLKNTFILWFVKVKNSLWDLRPCTTAYKIFFSFPLQNVFSPLGILNTGSGNQADAVIQNSIVSGPTITTFLLPFLQHCKGAGSYKRKLFQWAANPPEEPFSQDFSLWGKKHQRFATWQWQSLQEWRRSASVWGKGDPTPAAGQADPVVFSGFWLPH